jgi:thioredoxin-like negative regulator of GroEL
MWTALVMVLLAGVVGAETEATNVQTYSAAYRKAADEDKPLVVVIGAEWCPACQKLKHTTLASMEAEGQLDEVSVAEVNKDVEPELAQELMRGEMIPQVVVFSKNDEGNWKRMQLTGYQSKGTLRSIIRRAIGLRKRG